MKIPNNVQELQNMMKKFKATNEADKEKYLEKEPQIFSIIPEDHYSLKERIDLYQANLETLVDAIEFKMQKVKRLSSITDKLNINSEFYDSETNRMKNSIKKNQIWKILIKDLLNFMIKIIILKVP